MGRWGQRDEGGPRGAGVMISWAGWEGRVAGGHRVSIVSQVVTSERWMGEVLSDLTGRQG